MDTLVSPLMYTTVNDTMGSNLYTLTLVSIVKFAGVSLSEYNYRLEIVRNGLASSIIHTMITN